MRSRRTSLGLALVLSLVVAGLTVTSASASYHQNLIREVHDTGDNGDYVVLQAYAEGQNLLAGKKIVAYEGGLGPPTSVTLSNVPNGATQATVLAGDDTVPGADATDASFDLDSLAGTVCLTESDGVTGIDCVAYARQGSIAAFPPAPPASPYFPPVSIGASNLTGKSIVRSISRGCATLLEAADDTNNSAADFALGAPLARNNASPITESACPPGNPASPTNPAGKTRKRKCKKKHKRSAEAAKKKKCKKKKRR
jgi:hypothetical protein